MRRSLWKGWPLVLESKKEWGLRIERRGEERVELKEGQTKQGWKRSMKGNKLGEGLTGGNGWQDGE